MSKKLEYSQKVVEGFIWKIAGMPHPLGLIFNKPK
jgi:hypothetical protein